MSEKHSSSDDDDDVDDDVDDNGDVGRSQQRIQSTEPSVGHIAGAVVAILLIVAIMLVIVRLPRCSFVTSQLFSRETRSWGRYEMTAAVCLFVCLSVTCLNLAQQRKGLEQHRHTYTSIQM